MSQMHLQHANALAKTFDYEKDESFKVCNNTSNSLWTVSYQVDQNRNINETPQSNKYDILSRPKL